LIAGGFGSNYLSSAELFNPTEEKFLLTGSLTRPRINHTATVLLSRGRVLFTGGFDQNNIFSSAELYDSTGGVFGKTASMAITRFSHTATILLDEQVLIAGGDAHGGNFQVVGSAELLE
jgi:hypothetical protein